MHARSVRKLSPKAKKRLGKASKRKPKRRGRKAAEDKPKRKGRKGRKSRKARRASPAAHLKAIMGGVKLRKVSAEEKRYDSSRD